MNKIIYLLIPFIVMCITACGGLDDDDRPQPGVDDRRISEIIATSPEFSTLSEALSRTGLDISISGGRLFTIFAPTNAAFAASGLDLASIDTLELENILRYHLQSDILRTRESFLEGQLYISTANMDSPGGNSVQLFVEKEGDDVMLNSIVSLDGTQIFGNNGIIHPIEQVLLPPALGDMIRQNTLLSEFVLLLDDANPLASGSTVLDSLNTDNLFTVFAPLNSNFMPDPPFNSAQNLEVALYHIVGGRSTRFNDFPGTLTTIQGDRLLFTGRNVRTTLPQSLTLSFEDIQATNGVLHLVTDVLLPEGI